MWYVHHAVDVPELRPVRMPWYGHKRSTSFRDMLSAVRRVLWTHRNSANSPSGGKFSNFVRALIDALCSAA
jgi:hypothetical protein